MIKKERWGKKVFYIRDWKNVNESYVPNFDSWMHILIF